MLSVSDACAVRPIFLPWLGMQQGSISVSTAACGRRRAICHAWRWRPSVCPPDVALGTTRLLVTRACAVCGHDRSTRYVAIGPARRARASFHAIHDPLLYACIPVLYPTEILSAMFSEWKHARERLIVIQRLLLPNQQDSMHATNLDPAVHISVSTVRTESTQPA
jgi:hypothetical protein